MASSHLLGLKSPLEEAQKRSKAEAVHVVDLRQVCDDKIHLAGTFCKRQVGIPFLKKKKQGERENERTERKKPRCSRKRTTDILVTENTTNGWVAWKGIYMGG